MITDIAGGFVEVIKNMPCLDMKNPRVVKGINFISD